MRGLLNQPILQNLRFNLSPRFYKEHKSHNSDLLMFVKLEIVYELFSYYAS